MIVRFGARVLADRHRAQELCVVAEHDEVDWASELSGTARVALGVVGLEPNLGTVACEGIGLVRPGTGAVEVRV